VDNGGGVMAGPRTPGRLNKKKQKIKPRESDEVVFFPGVKRKYESRKHERHAAPKNSRGNG
jgi:hypothetical protein